VAFTFTAAARNAVGAQRFAAFSKFEITDPDGSWRDVSIGLLGVDWLNALTIDDDLDANAATLSGSLLRNTRLLSLSPFRVDSLVNRNAGGAYAPMLDLWRKWRASTAVMPAGYAPSGADWHEIASGRLDAIDIGDDSITLTGRSEDAVFLDCWITVERQYGSGAGVAAETVLQQMLDDNLGTGRANVGSSGYTVNTPVSPSVLIPTFTQQVGSLGAGLAAVAEQAKGFIFRMRYDSAGVNRPTFFAPARTATPGSEVWSLGPWEYTGVKKCAIDLTGMRNVVKLAYADPTLGKQVVYSPLNTGTVSCAAGAATFSVSQAGVIANGAVIVAHGISGCFVVSAFSGTTTCTLTAVGGGTPTFAASPWGTSASLTQYQKRVDLEIDLSAKTQVTTSATAQGAADAIQQDKSFPSLEQQIETLGFWFAQIYDYGKFYANGQHYDQDQYAGVTNIRHQLAQGTIVSTLGTRGKPAGRYVKWDRYSDQTVRNTPLARDTQQVQMRVTRVSETTDQQVMRVAAITPNVGGPVSIAYDAGGLTVSPASPQSIVATTDFATTATKDFTITRDTQGGTPRRVAFTGSASGYVDGTDGVDVPPNSARNRCSVSNSSTLVIATATIVSPVVANWGTENYDVGNLHDNAVNNSRITIPTGGGGRPWQFHIKFSFQSNATGDRYVSLRKNGVLAGTLTYSVMRAAVGNETVFSLAFIEVPADADYYEVFVGQDSGGNLNCNGTFGAVDLF
jgi:hypothetical protein